jgi:hypothetical protein
VADWGVHLHAFTMLPIPKHSSEFLLLLILPGPLILRQQSLGVVDRVLPLLDFWGSEFFLGGVFVSFLIVWKLGGICLGEILYYERIMIRTYHSKLRF